MKKSFLLLAVAVAAITSCTNDEVLDLNKSANIAFDSFVNKNTRAVTQTTTAGISKFYVYGSFAGTTSVFENKEVNKVSDAWVYTNPVAWTANEYKFAAYATTNSSTQLTSGIAYDMASGSLTFTDYVADNGHDLVAAVASVNNTSLANNTVNLTFKHLLSKVQFKFTSGADVDGQTMEISDITFSVQPEGTCEFNGAATWTPGSATPEVKTIPGKTGIAKAAVWTSEDQIVIPNQGLSTVKAAFTATFKDASNNVVNERVFANVPLALAGDAKWQPGYNYIYTATISSTTSYIKFDVTTVEGWVDSETAVTLP